MVNLCKVYVQKWQCYAKLQLELAKLHIILAELCKYMHSVYQAITFYDKIWLICTFVLFLPSSAPTPTSAKLGWLSISFTFHTHPLSPLKTHKNDSVFKICVWISVFRRKQAQLRLCKLGPGTVLIFYKSFAPTPIYM